MEMTPNPSGAPQTPKTSFMLPFNEGSMKTLFEGIQIRFPRFKHEHPAIIDVNKVVDGQLTVGDRVADTVAATVGSWPFIITQSIILIAWIAANVILAIYHSAWDPYPFILLNLALSFQAAYAAPFVMMSQNRQATKDRLTAENDYLTDTKGEQEIRNIMEHLDHQDVVIVQMLERIEAHHQQLLLRLSKFDPELASHLLSDSDSLTGEPAEE